MVDAQLRLFVGVTEYGIDSKLIPFVNAPAGEITEHSLNPFYLWNDKGGVLDSVPAKTVSIIVENMWIQDELLGQSDGTTNQTYNTDVNPILITANAEDLVLKVGGTVWTKVSNFAGQGTLAEVYTIDTNGLVTFGDGVNGRIPTWGNNITITYMPDLVAYGKNIYEGLWFEVKSSGCTSNVVTVVNEQQNAQTTTLVTVANTKVQSVTGVWLHADTNHTGTNFYTGGSFDENTGEITLGIALSQDNYPVLIEYSYIMIDDLEGDYTSIGEAISHAFTNQIPQNNAKLLYFRLNLPANVNPSGGSNIGFRLKVSYDQ